MKIGKVYHRKLIFFDHCKLFSKQSSYDKAVLFVAIKHLFTSVREPQTAHIADNDLIPASEQMSEYNQFYHRNI